MARLKIGDTRIAYRLEGKDDAPALVFGHSLATSADMWRYQIAEFASRYRILAYDMRGHGDSDAPDYPYDFGLLSDDVAQLMRACGMARAVFVGISIGGMIGQALALRHPELLSGLVLASTTAKTPPEGRALWDQRLADVRRHGLEPQVAPTLERWFSADFRRSHPEIVGWIADMIRSTSVEGYVGCGQAIMRLDFIGRLPAIKIPTLIIAGENDPGAPPSAAKAIAEAIGGAKLEILPACLHQTAIEAPGRFNGAVGAFLASLGL